MNRPLTRSLLLLAFLLSGFSTLTYEIVWVKHLVYLFGVTYHAITTVVTVFMAGLAFGALVAGRSVDRSRRPLAIYAGLELLIAGCGLAFPVALAVVSQVYHQVHDAMQVGFFTHTLVRFTLACALLLVPTIAMGATLPALARFFVLSREQIGFDIGRLYGVNTVGAAAGCALTGFLLLYTLGLQITNLLAVSLNLLAAGLALALHLWARRSDRPAAEPSPAPARTQAAEEGSAPRAPSWLLAAFFLSGFTAVAYELLWTRIVALLHPNAHTLVFSLVLTFYLLGNGLGSALYGPRLLGRLAPLRLYAAVQLVVAGLAALSVPAIFELRTRLGWQWYEAWDPARDILDLYLSQAEFLVIAAAVGLPALLFGLTFPLGNRLYVRRFTLLGSGVGAVYFFGAVGGIAGSFLTGFVLMPLLGAKGCMFLLALLNGVLGVAMLAMASRHSARARLVGSLVAVAALAALLYRGHGFYPTWIFLNIPTAHEVVFYKDGRSTSDGVVWVQQGEQRVKMLFANGEFVSAGAVGVWLPIALHPDPERVLILAFDTGASSGMALRDPRVQAVEAADISDVQEEIAAHFVEANDGVIADPRFRLVANDGRNHLLTSRRRYPVIFNGVAAYSGYLELSTREFFEIARSRLEDGGIFAHKIHPHMLTPEGLRRVVATFLEVFPDASLWQARVSSVLLLVGSNDAQPPRLDQLDSSRLGLHGPSSVEAAALFLTDAEGLAAVAADGRILVDDLPPRLGDLLTLIDTGSDFLAKSPHQSAMSNYEREINGILFRHESPPGDFFDGITDEEHERITAIRARNAPPGYGPEPAPGRR